MNEMPNLLVSALACLLTFFVVRQVLRAQLKLGPPNLVAALVAGLAFLGLCDSGGLLSALLISYAAMASAFIILFLWLRFPQFAGRLGRAPTESWPQLTGTRP